MKETEFNKIGKNIPYEVPDGFFENISEKTLQQIKIRELRRKKVLSITRIVAVAASLTILISFAFFLSRQGNERDKGGNQMSELTNKIDSPQKLKKVIPPKALEDSKKLLVEKPVPVKTAPVVIQEDERIDDILPDLSEEDLLQLAALYKADPFNE